jgi:hypothetical protein
VAVVGGAGAVGGYAIQLAKADGLRVVTDASPGDEELVRSFGPDVVVARGDDGAIRQAVPEGVPGLIDSAALDTGVLPAVADRGHVATLRGWSGPATRGITVHPISSYGAAGETRLLDGLRAQVEAGVLTYGWLTSCRRTRRRWPIAASRREASAVALSSTSRDRCKH